MNYQALSIHAKKNYSNIKVCSLEVLDDKYVFVCNSMLKRFNELGIEEGGVVYIDGVELDATGTPIFIVNSSFDIDINLLTEYEILYLSASS